MGAEREEQLYRVLCEAVQEEAAVCRREPMSRHTTFRTGGPAKLFVCPKDKDALVRVLTVCREWDEPWFILGNGSNLLVSDRGFPGVMIAMEPGFHDVFIDGNRIRAGAGAMLSRIARKACEAGLTGLEFAAGIPGTLGGAAVMNAGAYGAEMKDVLESVLVLREDGKEQRISAEALELGYRTSSLARQGKIVLEAVLCLRPGRTEEIQARMEELSRARKEKQPLEYPSAGSTFKRPQGYFAGKLIQDAGLKGMQIGGAQVSEKHSGFIINRKDAAAQDIYYLCRHVAGRVKEQFGVELELEVRLLGEFAEDAGGKHSKKI